MSFQKTKIDPVLGLEIHKHLLKQGVETPTIDSTLIAENKEKITKLEKSFTDIWKTMGLDLTDDSLHETPKRMAKMWVLETMWGLIPENFPKCTTVQNKMGYDEMVVEKTINVSSQCEHHGVVFTGHANIAYIPKDKVLGLSKLPRIVEYFSKRPQIQERLTEQVYHALEFILGTNDIAITIDAAHMCVSQRGVEDTSARTTTSKLGGVFKEPAVRAEFFQIIK